MSFIDKLKKTAGFIVDNPIVRGAAGGVAGGLVGGPIGAAAGILIGAGSSPGVLGTAKEMAKSAGIFFNNLRNGNTEYKMWLKNLIEAVKSMAIRLLRTLVEAVTKQQVEAGKEVTKKAIEKKAVAEKAMQKPAAVKEDIGKRISKDDLAKMVEKSPSAKTISDAAKTVTQEAVKLPIR